MHAALAGDRRSGKEEIHQHRLAGADLAEDVEALRRIDPAPGEAKARLPAAAIARRTVAAQGVVQRLQLLRRQKLAGVVAQVALASQRAVGGQRPLRRACCRSEEHTSELQSLMRISYAVFCLKKKTIVTKKK